MWVSQERKKNSLFLYCRERRQYGELVRLNRSRFLAELPNDDVLWERDNQTHHRAKTRKNTKPT